MTSQMLLLAYLGADASVTVANCKSFFSVPFEVVGSSTIGSVSALGCFVSSTLGSAPSMTGSVSSMIGCVSSVSMFISPRFARFASRPRSCSTGDVDRSRFTDNDAVEGVGTGSLSDDIGADSSDDRTSRIYDPLPAASQGTVHERVEFHERERERVED